MLFEWPVEVILVFIIASFYLGYHTHKAFKRKGCSKCNCGDK